MHSFVLEFKCGPFELSQHVLLPPVPAPGVVSAPQNAPFFWPPLPDVATPGALQEVSETTVSF